MRPDVTTVTTGELIDKPEPGVVAGSGMLRPRIAEADDEFEIQSGHESSPGA